MNARLGFSIAAHLDPDVLLIDEVLSVGDMAFQQRCIERMRDFKQQGATIVFVSHNLQAVAGLCDRALYLQREVRALGPSLDVIEQYVRATDRAAQHRPRGAVEIVRASCSTSTAGRRSSAPSGARLTSAGDLSRRTPPSTICCSVSSPIDRPIGCPCTTRTSARGELRIAALRAGQEIVVDFHFRAHLTRGQYHLGCHVFDTAHAGHTPTACADRHLHGRESRTPRRHRRSAGRARVVEPAAGRSCRGKPRCSTPVSLRPPKFSRGRRRLRRAVPAHFPLAPDSRPFSTPTSAGQSRLLNWSDSPISQHTRPTLCSESVRGTAARCGCDD